MSRKIKYTAIAPQLQKTFIEGISLPLGFRLPSQHNLLIVISEKRGVGFSLKCCKISFAILYGH